MSDDASTPEVPEKAAEDAGRGPWAAPGSVPDGVEGPQYASAEGEGEPWEGRPEGDGEPSGGEFRVSLGKGGASGGQEDVPLAVHEQRTVTPLPEVTPAGGGGGPQGWAAPVGPPVSGGLAAYPPPNPATAVGGPSPFVQDGAVPLPPIAPDGPGQVPYGYPGQYGGGYPGQVPYGGVPGYHGWPGMRPMENGMGVSAMVLGILAAGGFCMWPVAIVMGVLAIVFGAIGRARARRGEASNGGQALAGIICGAAGLVLGIGFAVLIFLAP